MTEDCKLAIDTGTSLITGPSQDIVLLLRMINLNSQCNNYDSLPTISIHMDDY